MKKTLYTLCVDNYEPEITKLTFPLMKSYAQKIGAEFYIIKDRKFPKFPCPYEKFQISKLSKERKDEWSVFFDADALIHPDMWDPTSVVSKAVTISNGTDFTPIRFKPNKYFSRDGRNIGKGNWCMMGSDWTAQDLWRPHDSVDPETIAKEISPTVAEHMQGVDGLHLIDDYTVSLNISRYGLQHMLIKEIRDSKDRAISSSTNPDMLFHIYLNNGNEKVVALKRVLFQWAYNAMTGRYSGLSIQERSEIDNVIKRLQTYDGSVDWDELISILPFGRKVIDTIKYWGIDINYIPLEKLSYNSKKLFLMSLMAYIPEGPAKNNDIMSINNMPEDVKFNDYLETVSIKEFVKGKIKAWKLEL